MPSLMPGEHGTQRLYVSISQMQVTTVAAAAHPGGGKRGDYTVGIRSSEGVTWLQDTGSVDFQKSMEVWVDVVIGRKSDNS